MHEDAKELLQLCQDFKDEGVVGLELAGYDFNIEVGQEKIPVPSVCFQGVLAEEGGSLSVDFLLFSPDDIAIFEEAKVAKVNFYKLLEPSQVHRSVHAGEFGPSDVVFQAIERLGAERIVFGYSVSLPFCLLRVTWCRCTKTRRCTATWSPARCTSPPHPPSAASTDR